MNHIDVRLATAPFPGSLLVEIADPLGWIETRAVEIPLDAPIELEKAYRLWLGAYTRHAVTCEAAPGAEQSSAALADRERKLIARMRLWLKQPGWQGWQEALERSDLPIRLSFSGLGETSWLEKLPWEAMVSPSRALWRGRPDSPLEGRKSKNPKDRRPHLLVIVGDEQDLPLEKDIEVMRRLERLGKARLTLLRGPRCTRENLEKSLRTGGIDALVFLGHSREDQWEGGWIELGNGRHVSGEALAEALATASRQGLQLALLSSCSGIPLARTLTACGLDWVVCFRELVPTQVASESLVWLLEEMQKGESLQVALRRCRERLGSGGRSASSLLASIYSRYGEGECRLPLSRQERFWQRLKSSPRTMAIPAGVALVLSMFSEWPGLNTGAPQMAALNMRMAAQQLFGAPGKLANPQTGKEAVSVLVVDEMDYTTHDDLCAAKGNGALVSHDLLARILDAITTSDVRTVGIDYELKEDVVKGSEENWSRGCSDRPPHDSAIEVLSSAVERFTSSAPNRTVVAVQTAEPDCTLAGARAERPSPKQKALMTKGLEFVSACLPVRDDKAGIRLRTKMSLGDRPFAYAVSNQPSRSIPRNAVIDWTIDWSARFQQVPNPDWARQQDSARSKSLLEEELRGLKSEVLIIGSGGFRRKPGQGGETEIIDRWQAPWPVWYQDTQRWRGLGLKNGQIPGVVVQAVFSQSLRDGHWIMPIPYLVVVVLIAGAGGLGIVLGAVSENRKLLLLMAATIAAFHAWFALQSFADKRLLVPIVLPAAVLVTTPFARRR